MMRLPVAVQKTLQPHHPGGLRLADQHRAAGAGFNQRHAAQNQRAHQPLAQIGFGNDQRAQLAGGHQQRFNVFFGMPVHQRHAARQLPHFGQKFAWPLPHDGHDVAHAVALGDGHHALQHHKHARPGLAGGEKPVTALVMQHLAEAPDPVDLLRTQEWKHLVPAIGGASGLARLAFSIKVRLGCRNLHHKKALRFTAVITAVFTAAFTA